LPLIIFWNAATGHPPAAADFAFAMAASNEVLLRDRQDMGMAPNVHTINFVHTCATGHGSAR
jgi:hypothetical protein